jgi:xanthine/uracil permease
VQLLRIHFGSSATLSVNLLFGQNYYLKSRFSYILYTKLLQTALLTCAQFSGEENKRVKIMSGLDAAFLFVDTANFQN